MVRNRFMRVSAVACVLALTAAACGGDDDESADATATAEESATAESSAESSAEAPATTAAAESSAEAPATTAPAEESSASAEESSAPADDPYAAVGLWNDGPCDSSLPTLHVGLITVFETGVLTLIDQAQALEASVEAFNARGGANGACIEVTTCDDGADPNKAVECVRTIDEAGVAVTINDTTTFGGADVAAGLEAAGIPRFAISPGQDDYPNLNSYPFDAGGTGTSIMMPQALLDAGVTKIAIVRVDSPAATQLGGFYQAVFADNGLEVVADLPVPAGTTDYSQFILAAQAAGAEGIAMPIGGQEGIQVLRAGAQLDADLLYSSSLGTFPAADIASLGEYGSRVILNAAIPPATADLPVIDILAEDLAASGVDALQRDNLKSSPMRSWVGLYGLLAIVREAGLTDFNKETVKAAIEASGPIDMIGLLPDWTPKTDHEGAFTRTGQGYYAFWTYDEPSGTFALQSEANWDEVICGSPVGGAC